MLRTWLWKHCRLVACHFACTTQNRHYNWIIVWIIIWKLECISIASHTVAFSNFFIQEFTFGNIISLTTLNTFAAPHIYKIATHAKTPLALYTVVKMYHTVGNAPCVKYLIDCIHENRKLKICSGFALLCVCICVCVSLSVTLAEV